MHKISYFSVRDFVPTSVTSNLISLDSYNAVCFYFLAEIFRICSSVLIEFWFLPQKNWRPNSGKISKFGRQFFLRSYSKLCQYVKAKNLCWVHILKLWATKSKRWLIYYILWRLLALSREQRCGILCILDVLAINVHF